MLGKLGLALVDRAFLNKALIRLSVNGWGFTPSLVVFWPEATQPCGLCAQVNGSLQEGLCQGGPSRTAAASTPILC